MAAKEPEAVQHVCEWCGVDYICRTGFRTEHKEKISTGGVLLCHCIQEIVTDMKDNYEKTRLATWCSEECFSQEKDADEESDEDAGEESDEEDELLILEKEKKAKE